MLNSISLIGRLTADAQTNEACSVANFTIAVDNLTTNEDGTRDATFIPCKAFNKVAEIVVDYTKKGDKVGISGRIQQRNFTRKDGSKGSVLEVIVESLELIEPRVHDEEEEEIQEPSKKYSKPSNLKPSKR